VHEEQAFRERIRHRKLRRLFDYWDLKRGTRALPGRPDIDPIDLAFILGNLILLELHQGDGRPRYRFRVHGSNLARRAGFDMTGKWMDDYPDADYGQVALASFDRTAISAVPFHNINDRMLAGRMRGYETVMLPLAADGEHVDMLLIGLIYNDE